MPTRVKSWTVASPQERCCSRGHESSFYAHQSGLVMRRAPNHKSPPNVSNIKQGGKIEKNKKGEKKSRQRIVGPTQRKKKKAG